MALLIVISMLVVHGFAAPRHAACKTISQFSQARALSGTIGNLAYAPIVSQEIPDIWIELRRW